MARVDAVRAPIAGWFVPERAAFQDGKQIVDVGQKNVRGPRVARPDMSDVGRCHALMHKPRLDR
jgi:hypothetical protein